MATVKLTTEEFKNKVFDYTQNTEWKYAGDTPARGTMRGERGLLRCLWIGLVDCPAFLVTPYPLVPTLCVGVQISTLRVDGVRRKLVDRAHAARCLRRA